MDVIEAPQLSGPQALGHWYYDAKFRLLKHHLATIPSLDKESRLADVGCGVGILMTMLEREGIFYPGSMTGVDPAYTAPAIAQGGSSQILPGWPENQPFNIALLMDVLEHVADDEALLNDVASHLAPNGNIFVTVPAFSWLWSAHDRFLGHHRRYTIKTLGALVARVGALRIRSLHYYYASIFPVAAPWRVARRSDNGADCSDLARVSPWINKALLFASSLELKLAARNRLGGLSVVALCEKV
ncbi:MAG TPA: class I SAM-dependent methyltransferase [Chthoniobacterales bacterium]